MRIHLGISLEDFLCSVFLYGARAPQILVRPHPLNLTIWEGFSQPDATVYPTCNRDIFYSMDARRIFFESLHYSIGVIGLNTTAMVETAIVDKPTITWLNERYASTQELSGHFHHLADAGFMETARTSAEVTDKIGRLLADEDPGRECRRTFVTDFIRPWGRGVAASVVMKEALLAIAQHRALVDICRDLARMGSADTGATRTGQRE